MLEVNDFDAIRIALASSDQVRSWSYGEVTKPETINYRTLKPEKDGLFCEKIFGPQKDFECMCGKYKRVRYKGIICDKCGVEVTRSKVRRERMGHIELAAPVSHIWFVKGTPSRMALLLDISPRALERVLYFAQFIITAVNDEQRAKAIERLKLDAKDDVEDAESDLERKLAQVEEARETALAEIQTALKQALQANEEALANRTAVLQEEAQALREAIEESDGKTARRNLKLGEVVIVRYTEPVVARRVLKTVEKKLAQQIRETERQAKKDAAAIEKQAARDEQETRDRFFAQEDGLREQFNTLRDEINNGVQDRLAELAALRDPVQELDFSEAVLTEQRAEELRERYPGVIQVGMGAEALLSILDRIDLEELSARLQNKVASAVGQRRKKAMKRLRVVEALRKSGNKAQWMVFQALPVLPPDLRPMVQLDGGRFATSDLNDLYRRVINRNNRLKRLLELGAPEIIIRNEKRMLQESVDSLIDNGRRGRTVTGSGNHKLKSLSDMLKGKQGRFRQNLLGKRVDYAGRSVIVVGPKLKLHQCGLPKRMALELFKPFIMHELVERGLAHNIKSAKRVVERAHPEVWDVLDDVVRSRPVLLNRAPTLHRLGIQAFEPVLVDGSAIQIHPLVCAAFNADFDGDQMAVHVPLSREAVAEARQIMLSTRNLLSPSSGEPVIAPTLDMVMGCYYLTIVAENQQGEYRAGPPPQGVYGSFAEARLAHDLNKLALHAKIRVRDARTNGALMETTVGRIIFDEVVPKGLPYQNALMDKKALKGLVTRSYVELGADETAELADRIKHVGFRYATRSGITIAVDEIRVPEEKESLLQEAQQRVEEIREQYQMGLMTGAERYDQTVQVWTEATDKVTNAISDHLGEYGSVYLMVASGAKGNIAQVRQMAGMRGLMSDPSGRIIELPIRSSFKEGLSVLEYFISTHGARKGLADTALRTADSGYLTRRLIDVAQDVIVRDEDCGNPTGLLFREQPEDRGLLEPLRERVAGRFLAGSAVHPETGEVLAESGTLLDEEVLEELIEQGVSSFYVRTPMLCNSRVGVCQRCYGRSLATGRPVEIGEAVGIIAAQSIGEPGTQLTMRTFHTGGVAGQDITSGLPRVEELFEARAPKGQAVIAEIDGQVSILREGEIRKVRLTARETFRDEYELPAGARTIVKDGDEVEEGAELATLPAAEEEAAKPTPRPAIRARVAGRVERKARARKIGIVYEHEDVREYAIPAAARLRLDEGAQVQAGDQITEGAVNPQDMLRILGVDAVHRYLVTEVQQVYRAQGVNINDKHIEVIVRQMLRRVRIEHPGDSDLLAGELIDRFAYEELNQRLLAAEQEPATAQSVLLGVTRASLSVDSWLAAASFQETTRVLTEAAVQGSVDQLEGLKENVIIGKLIPARSKIELPSLPEPEPVSVLTAGGYGEDLFESEQLGRLSDEQLAGLGFSLDDLRQGAGEPVGAAASGGFSLDSISEEGYVAEPGEDD